MSKRWSRDLEEHSKFKKFSPNFLAGCYHYFGSHSQLWPNFSEIQRENSSKVSPHTDAVNSNE